MENGFHIPNPSDAYCQTYGFWRAFGGLLEGFWTPPGEFI